jgi:hypothetical protein
LIPVQPNLRFAILLVLLFLLLSPAACSRVSLGYNNAEFFIERYADSYLSLDSAQMAAWQPAVKEVLAHHRREELPYLAAFFDAAYQNTKSHFDAPAVECLLDAFEEIYRRHFRIIAALAAPFARILFPGRVQVTHRRRAHPLPRRLLTEARRTRYGYPSRLPPMESTSSTAFNKAASDSLTSERSLRR